MRAFGWFATAVALIFSGCTTYENPFMSSGPTPRVEDCAQIQQATPTRFVCGGKSYTSVQLSEIRAQKNADQRTAAADSSALSRASSSPPASSTVTSKKSLEKFK